MSEAVATLTGAQWADLWLQYFYDRRHDEVKDLARAYSELQEEPEFLPRVVIDLDDVEDFDACNAHRLLRPLAPYARSRPDLAMVDAAQALRDDRNGYAFEAKVGFQDVLSVRHGHELAPRLLGRLVAVRGLISSVGPRKEQLVEGLWKCPRCTAVVYEKGPTPPVECNEDDGGCGRTIATANWEGPLKNMRSADGKHGTRYITYREAVVVERVADIDDDGRRRMPEPVKVVVEEDLVRELQPGVDVIVTGIYDNDADRRHGRKPGDHDPFVRALSIKKDDRRVRPSPADIESFKSERVKPGFRERLIRSFFPRGGRKLDNLRKWWLLSLVGGVWHDGLPPERGSIHLLVVGDPGQFKSQAAMWQHRLNPNEFGFVTGTNASAVGLTAGLDKDPVLGSHALQWGALVQYNGGHVAIDEFGDLDKTVHAALKTPMEQGIATVTKVKGGSYECRTTIIAIMNPPDGEFDNDSSVSLVEQLNFKAPILDRFDGIFFILGTHDFDEDVREGEQFYGLASDAADAVFDPQWVVKYTVYARSVRPVETTEALRELVLAGARCKGEKRTKSNRIKATLRRLSAAIAKLDLCEEVRVEHVRAAEAAWRDMMTTAQMTAKASAALLLNGKDPDMEELMRAIHGHVRTNPGVTVEDLVATFSKVPGERVALFAQKLVDRRAVYERDGGLHASKWVGS